ncbi:MAG: S-adenosylmethionine decarboxylase [Candidatus Caenarcaniphilales bacterium]|nr:S-adenosylmethionine decarboxylase [Candidatus Caenarcaniphilales bacterium]
MHKIAPEIFRQRLLIEGFYDLKVDEEVIKKFFAELTNELNLKAYGEPIIFSPEGMGKEDNQGYDAFIPLIDSGISLYVWTSSKFFSLIIFTCKSFDRDLAIEFTKKFFKVEKFESQDF